MTDCVTVNFPFPDSDVPCCTISGVYRSQLIRFASLCSHVGVDMLVTLMLSQLRQSIIRKTQNSPQQGVFIDLSKSKNTESEKYSERLVEQRDIHPRAINVHLLNMCE